MPNGELLFCNDNIRTSHLKCDRCKTQNTLKGIERSKDFETRLFECAHCSAVKAVRIDTPSAVAGWPQNRRLFDRRATDRTSC